MRIKRVKGVTEQWYNPDDVSGWVNDKDQADIIDPELLEYTLGLVAILASQDNNYDYILIEDD